MIADPAAAAAAATVGNNNRSTMRLVRGRIFAQLIATLCVLKQLPFLVGGQLSPLSATSAGHALTEAEHKESLMQGGAYTFFEILDPQDLRYTYKLSNSQFSPIFNTTTMTSKAVSLVPAVPVCACGALNNDLRGRVALIERGECSFVSKAVRAQAGAVGAIITDSDRENDELMINMVDDQTGRSVGIPVAFLHGKSGHYIRTVLEQKGLERALIHIPINITQRSIVQLNQPPWLIW